MVAYTKVWGLILWNKGARYEKWSRLLFRESIDLEGEVGVSLVM